MKNLQQESVRNVKNTFQTRNPVNYEHNIISIHLTIVLKTQVGTLQVYVTLLIIVLLENKGN